MLRYRTFPTTADLGLFVYGESPEEVFENFAYALKKIVAGNGKLIPTGNRTIELELPSLEMGFFLWASELLYLYDSEGLLPERAEVRIHGSNLRGEILLGEFRKTPQVYIKAVTMHKLTFEKRGRRWRASLVLDL